MPREQESLIDIATAIKRILRYTDMSVGLISKPMTKNYLPFFTKSRLLERQLKGYRTLFGSSIHKFLGEKWQECEMSLFMNTIRLILM